MRYSLTIMLFLAAIQLYAQDPLGEPANYNYDDEIAKMVTIPTAPEASEFVKYGNTPVNMFDGTPNIEVPLYVHKGRELDLPVSLTYNASGIKVDQLPTIVGLGWNLKAGGMITRMVNGAPDDFVNAHAVGPYQSWYDDDVRRTVSGYLNRNLRLRAGSSLEFPGVDGVEQANRYLDSLYDIHRGKYETQPDFYSVNIMGVNDMFVLDFVTKEPKVFKNSRLKVEYNPHSMNTAVDSGINSFTVTGDDGTKYEFVLKETTRTVTDSYSDNFNGRTKHYHSGWYIQKITSPNGKDIYEFSYSVTQARNQPPDHTVAEVTTPLPFPGSSGTYGGIPGDPSAEIYNYVTTTTTYFGPTWNSSRQTLTEIKHNGVVIVNFNLTDGIDGGPDSGVTSIDIFNKNTGTYSNDLLKRIDLNYSYFKTSSGIPLTNHGHVRLKLDGVDIKGKGDVEQQYAFDYYKENGIAALGSRSKDYLGYFNAAPSDQDLFVRMPSEYEGVDGGGSRGPNLSFARRGNIKKIQYPTKGYTIFNYELDAVTESESNTNWVTKADFSYSPVFATIPDPEQCNHEGASGPITPSVSFEPFEILPLDDGDHKVTFNLTGTGPEGTINEQAYIVKVEGLSTDLTWEDMFDSDCNLKPGINLIWSHAEGEEESWVYLTEGWYQIVLPVHGLDYTKQIVVEGIENNGGEEIVEFQKAGLRVSRIKDYTEDGVIASVKDYEYTGVLLSEPEMFYITKSNHFHSPANSGICTMVERDILHRPTTPLNADKQHVGYSKVVETIKDASGTSNYGSTVYRFESMGKIHTSRSGAYKLRMSNAAGAASNYSFDVKAGAQVYKAAGSMRESISFGDRKARFSNGGAYIGSDSRHDNLFPVIEQTGGNTYINLVAGSPYLLNTGSCGVQAPSHPLNIGNCKVEIARLILNGVSVWGYDGSNQIRKEVQELTDAGDKINVSTYSYQEDNLVKEISTSNSLGEKAQTKLWYPKDMSTSPLIFKNMLTVPVKTESYNGGIKTYTQINNFYSDALPSYVETAKGDVTPETRLNFVSYDSENNLTEAVQQDGMPVTYLWGYDYRYPVAMINNANYTDVMAGLGISYTALQDLEDNALVTRLSVLRNWLNTNKPEAQITTYTYNPSIGAATIKDPSGLESSYHYDDFHRLQYIKDFEDNIVKEYGYNTLYTAPDPGGSDPYENPYSASNTYANFNLDSTGPHAVVGVAGLTGGSGNFKLEWYYSLNGNDFVKFDTTYDGSDPVVYHYFSCDPSAGWNGSEVEFMCRITDLDPYNTAPSIDVLPNSPVPVICEF